MGGPKKYYAVRKGRRPGIYSAWFGSAGAEAQVRGIAGARYKGFSTLMEARQWMDTPEAVRPSPKKKRVATHTGPSIVEGEIVIYTDGGCIGNPGPGGYGVIIIAGGGRTELARGFRRTTNNRMELMACIAALDSLKAPSNVVLHSDSSYVVNGIAKGWARRWRANNWMRTEDEAAQNSDLWSRLLDLCESHRVRFVWVRGHAGNRENERCDALATGAASGPDLADDKNYVQGRTTGPF